MINFNIKYLQEADSTNDCLKRLMINNELEEGTVILAEYQKTGRGRGQNRWHSAKGQNLTMSLLFHPGIQAKKFFYLTELISLSIVDFLFSFNIEASIKWPNDIYVGNNKIAGILIENTILSNQIAKCIAGIGININEVDFPPDLPNPTSMRMLKQATFDKNALLEISLDKIRMRYNQLISGDLESMHDEYNQKLYKRSARVQYRNRNGIFYASIKEIKPSGELILRNEDNSEMGYLFGEIEMV